MIDKSFMATQDAIKFDDAREHGDAGEPRTGLYYPLKHFPHRHHFTNAIQH